MAEIRLQKYLARAGVASRRHAEELIAAGQVCVDGAVVTEMGVKVDPGLNKVTVNGQVVELPSENATFMLHKPAGYVTTMSDPQGRPTVAELVPLAAHPSLFPVGRLDDDTSGLLLFSTDGELGHALLHPARHVPKRYLAYVEGELTQKEAQRLREGILLEDGLTAPAEITLLQGKQAREAARLIGSGKGSSGAEALRKRKRLQAQGRSVPSASYVEVILREGRKRQVRNMLKAVGHPVIALHRQQFGPLDLGDLKRGSCRELTLQEVEALRQATM